MGTSRRKLEVLEYVRDNESTTSSELAEALDLEIHNARTLLRKYNREGLLSRRKVDVFGTREYMITDKGLRRIEWLKEHP